MSYRDFDSYLQEKMSGKPSFTIAGETFTCRARLPWKKFSYLMLSLGTKDPSVDEVERTQKFFNLVLVPTDKQRFFDLLDRDDEDEEDEDKIVSNDHVRALLDWLLPYYLGKVEESASDSSDSPPSTGQPVNVISASLNPSAT